jgi:predicted nucleic acid-binding protein
LEYLLTSYLLALELTNDQNHQSAKAHWQQFTSKLPLLVTTSYVFDEVVTYFNSRGHHRKAVEVGNNLLYSPSVTVIQVDEELFLTSWDYFRRHQDKQYSLTDCISFVVMEQSNIDIAFAFDQHFTQAGFQREPHVSK